MEWLNSLSKAIEYIENHLEQEISFDEAARIASCSTYYFQRIFSYVAGISLAEYIRRRRMTQAAFELQRTDKKVLEIASKYGYASPTSFNRAFQSVHGISPVAAKQKGAVLNPSPPIRFSVKVSGGSAMSYHIIEKPAFHIVGIRMNLVDDMEENQKNVPLFWEQALNDRRFSELCELNNAAPNGILGISVYENPENIFYYIATSSTNKAPDGICEYEIPASTWVVFENDGYFKENVQSVFRRLYTEWLPFSGYEYAGLPDIEVYPIQNKTVQSGHSEVWIAIRKGE